jgi:Protein of unknown function (DUF3562)
MSSQIQKESEIGTVPDPSGSLHEHVIAIQELANDFNLPTQVVADMYWPQLARLKQGATIDLYLPLLTERRVRDSLRRIPRASKVRKAAVSALSG